MKNTDNQFVENETQEELNIEQPLETDNMADNQEQDTATEAVDWQDRYVRLSAEFDNYRKRTLKEKMELLEFGGADVLKSVVSVVDDFERAMAAMQDGPDKEGISLIHQNFIEILKSKGVTEIKAQGEIFNVDFHEAIAKVPATAECCKDVIVDVVQKGYMMKTRVLRFAKVVVAE